MNKVGNILLTDFNHVSSMCAQTETHTHTHTHIRTHINKVIKQGKQRREAGAS